MTKSSQNQGVHNSLSRRGKSIYPNSTPTVTSDNSLERLHRHWNNDDSRREWGETTKMVELNLNNNNITRIPPSISQHKQFSTPNYKLVIDENSSHRKHSRLFPQQCTTTT